MYVQTGSQKKDLGSSRKLSRAKEFSPWQGEAGCGLGDMGGPGMWALYSSVCLTDGRMDPIISWAFPSQPPSVTISRSGAILSFSSLWKALVMFCTFVTSFMQQPFTDPLGVWIYNVIHCLFHCLCRFETGKSLMLQTWLNMQGCGGCQIHKSPPTQPTLLLLSWVVVSSKTSPIWPPWLSPI